VRSRRSSATRPGRWAGAHRDAGRFGGVEQAARAFDNRYHAACRQYLAEVDPAAHATIVVANDDPQHPVLRRIGGDQNATVPLFSYGTLQLPQVQLSNFGRPLDGTPDSLPGHHTTWVTITDPAVITASGTDRHPTVLPTGNHADVVAGTVFTVTTTELAAADHYEVDDYRRVLAPLGSGTHAWVYLAAPPV
jgi:Gamma-glutamyl cyclotransferase, AIG2-like